jgi:long-subunit acyl-CoA synthetase (AMP-forming)
LMDSTPTLWERLCSVRRLRVSDSAGAEAPDPRLQASLNARELLRMGFKRGNRLAVVLPNGPEFVGVFLACLELEIVFVPVNPNMPKDEAIRRYRVAGVSGVWDAQQGPQRAVLEPVEEAEPSRLPAAIVFTSGSGGDARPVALAGSSLLHVADTHHLALGYNPGAAVLGVLPWSHAFGFTLELLMGLLFEGVLRSVPSNSFSETFQSSPGDYLFAVPRLIESLGDKPLGDLQGGIVGGAPVRGEVRRRLQKTRLRVGYGQTECGPGVTLGEPGEWERDDFLGRAIGCEVALRPGPYEGAGELCVQGPNLAMGYLPSGESSPLALEEGWHGTGDLATRFRDGFVFQGRKDELFKLDNGRMVNPVPLELPYEGRVLLIGEGREAVQPLARGELPRTFSLPVPHLPPKLMPETFWAACTTPTGKISRRRAQTLFYQP